MSFSKYSARIPGVLDQCHPEFSFPPFSLNVRILTPGMMDEWREERRGEWAHDSMRWSSDAALT